MSHVPSLAVAAILALTLPGEARAEEPPVRGSPPTVGHDPAHPPIDCPLHQKGVNPGALRPFEETEKYIAFLERADRAIWQRPDDVVAALHLVGTETVSDVGAGSGYFAFRFAKALPKGKVIATDIDPEMVRHIHHKVMSGGITNVHVKLADPKVPGVSPEADIVFVCDVIHHVDGREAWLRAMSAEMKPGGRLVVVEFKEGNLPEGPPEAVKIPKTTLSAMILAAGFELEADHQNVLPYQTFLVFQKPMPNGVKSSR